MRQLKFIIILLLLLMVTTPALAQQTASTSGQGTGSPVALPELLQRANEAYAAGNDEQAIIDYSLFILLNPTFSQAYYNRALSYEAAGDLNQAIQDLGRALNYNVPSPEYAASILLVRAQMYLNQNNLQAALTDLNASIDTDPQAIDSISLRAQLLSFLERYPAALSDYDRLIELEPDEPVHYVDRGFTHAQLGNVDDALGDYSRAIDLDPDDARPYVSRAIYYSSLEAFNEALTDINNAIEINPDIGEFYLLRGSIKTSVDQPAEAADDYFHWLTLNRTQEFRAQTTLTDNQIFTVEMGPGWIYNIPFNASEGQTVSIAARAASDQTPVDPLLVILGVNGSPVIADDDSGGNLAAFIRDYTIPEDGEYTIVVGHAAGGAPQGNIDVRVDLGLAALATED